MRQQLAKRDARPRIGSECGNGHAKRDVERGEFSIGVERRRSERDHDLVDGLNSGLAFRTIANQGAAIRGDDSGLG